MGNDYKTISFTIPSTNFTKAQFEASLRELAPTTIYENVTGAGALDADYVRARLNAESGTIALTLADGTEENQRKHLEFVGSESSTAVFNVTGNFRDYATLQFDVNARMAELIWDDVNSVWVFALGTARGIA